MIQFVSRPTSWYDIDLVSGQSTLHGLLSPAHDVNAIGYSLLMIPSMVTTRLPTLWSVLTETL